MISVISTVFKLCTLLMWVKRKVRFGKTSSWWVLVRGTGWNSPKSCCNQLILCKPVEICYFKCKKETIVIIIVTTITNDHIEQPLVLSITTFRKTLVDPFRTIKWITELSIYTTFAIYFQNTVKNFFERIIIQITRTENAFI